MPFATIVAALAILIAPMASGNSPRVNQTISKTNSATSVETVLTVTSETVSIPPATPALKRAEVEEIVRTFYKETPILAEIAFCESTFRHIDKNGNLLRGKVDSGDIGVMQINERWHRIEAEKLGHNIDTFDGNLKYGQWLYEQKGTVPWNASKPCWSQYQ